MFVKPFTLGPAWVILPPVTVSDEENNFYNFDARFYKSNVDGRWFPYDGKLRLDCRTFCSLTIHTVPYRFCTYLDVALPQALNAFAFQ